MTRKIFVNLPIANLKRSVEFFTKLGFTFNAQFTSEDTTCMIVNDDAFVMLLEKKRFEGFIKRPVADANAATGVLMAVSADSRAKVDDMVKAALANGGKPALNAQDHGFMYSTSFYDLDGHHWEVMWMDPDHIKKAK